MRAAPSFVALAVAASCTEFGSAPERAAGDAPDAAAGPEAASPVAAPADGAAPLACGASATPNAVVFCDDFEQAAPFPRGWSGWHERSGRLSLLPGAGASGSTGLRAALEGEGADWRQAFLRLDHAAAAQRWTYRLAFAASVRTTGELQGPRLVTTSADVDAGAGDRLDVFVAFTTNAVKIGTLEDACGGPVVCEETVGKTTPTSLAAGWHSYVLQLDVEPAAGPPYGKLLLTIDGTEAFAGNLGLPLSRSRIRSTAVGVSAAGKSVVGDLFVDDARIEIVAR